jgi:hypothetical protein
MDLSRPKPVEERVCESYADARADDELTHEEGIVEAIRATVEAGYDDEHLGRAMRALLALDETGGPEVTR